MNKLQEACIISHEHWLKELEQTIATLDIDIPEIKIPEKTKEKIVSIKDSQAKSRKNKSIKRKVIKILIIAAIIASLLMAVVAYAPFKDIIIETFPDHNLFANDSDKVNYPKNIDISYMPEGFVLTRQDNLDTSILKEYKYNEKSFVIIKSSPTAYFQVSNTYTEEVIFYNENIKYTFMQLKETVNIVVWLTEDYSYSMTGYNMTQEEMIELAKGIS